jgi:hypothetical protein
LLALRKGKTLDNIQLAALNIPNSTKSLECYAWMEYYFDLMGCQAPNCNEIHLEPITVTKIWDEYLTDFMLRTDDAVTLSQFCDIWKGCFPYVKIREFKAVSGKCDTCAMLSDARRTHKDAMSRAHITMMHQVVFLTLPLHMKANYLS